MFFSKILSGIKNLGRVFILKEIWPLTTTGQKIRLLLDGLLNIIDTGAKLLGPLALAKSVEAVEESKEQTKFLILELSPEILLYVAAAANGVHLVMPFLKKLAQYGIQESISETLSARIFKKTQELSIYTSSLNDLLSSASKHMQCANFESDKLLTSVTENLHPLFLDTVLGTAFIFTCFEKQVGGVVIAYIFSAVTINEFFSQIAKLSSRTQKARIAFSDYLRHLYEVNVNAETVYLFNRTKLEELNAHYFYSKYVKLIKKNARYELLSIIQPFLASAIQFFAVYYVARDNFQKFEIDEIIFLLNYVANISSSVYLMSQSYQSASTAADGIKEINNFVGIRAEKTIDKLIVAIETTESTPLLIGEKQDFRVSLTPVGNSLKNNKHKPKPAIKFKNVSFFYQSNELVLDLLSFKVYVGERVGLVGGSGVGKSTIIKLMCGLIRPSNPEAIIEIFGKNILNISLDQLNELFSIVRQQIEVFEENSVAYNTLYGFADDTLLLQMKKNEDHNKNQKLKQDLSTLDNETCRQINFAAAKATLEAAMTGKACSELSGGQRQRIGLARIWPRKAKLIILDEPTSNLDSLTEAQVLGNLKNMVGHTTLMIAHRLSTLRDADRILFLGNKTPSSMGASIIEEGTHTELLEQNGAYANLWNLQTR